MADVPDGPEELDGEPATRRRATFEPPAEPIVPDAPPPAFGSLGASSTLEAMEQLEAMLAHRAATRATPTPPPAVAEPAAAPRTPLVEPPPSTAWRDAPPPTPEFLNSMVPPPQGVVEPPELVEPSLLDALEDDAVDEIDRAPTGAVQLPVPAPVFEPLPSQPISLALAETELPIIGKPSLPGGLEVERIGPERAPAERRIARSVRMFWLWLPVNSSAVLLGLGATFIATGMNLRQAVVATLVGVALSFLPLGLGTLAGKWSGQPVMIVSRAIFGHVGNALPVIVAILSRVVWAGGLLWLFGVATSDVLVRAEIDGGFDGTTLRYVAVGAGAVVVLVVAFLGYGLIARLQAVLAVLAAVLVAGAVALTADQVDMAVALGRPDGDWLLVAGGALSVFAIVGMSWVHSSGDLARYQSREGSGGANMLWATFGATIPPFVLIGWGSVLAASHPEAAADFGANPLGALAAMLPSWYPFPLIAAAGLALISGAVIATYSGGFAIQALGIPIGRPAAALVAAIFAIAVGTLFVPWFDWVTEFQGGLIIVLAVPIAAWGGAFAAEMMLRRRNFHAESLLRPGGIYPAVRWPNLLVFLALTAVGWGLIDVTAPGMEWAGYLFRAAGVDPHSALGQSQVGIFAALLGALLLTLLVSRPGIRRQEDTLPPSASATAPSPAAEPSS